MQCFIKDGKSFRTKHIAPAVGDITIKSIYDEVSNITIPRQGYTVGVGDFIFTEGYAGIVNEVSAEDGAISLSCIDINRLFRRDLFPVEWVGAGIEEFIKEQIEREYVDVEDVIYRLPYLDVVIHTRTLEDVKPENSEGLWNLKSYFARVRRLAGVFVEFSADGDRLRVDIMRRDRPFHNIDLTMGGFEVLEESFSSGTTGRVTAKAEDTGEISDWYLLENGEIVNEYTAADRVEGEWAKLVVDGVDDVETQVKNIFNTNSYSHMIEFATYKKYGFYDECVLKTPGGKIVRSYISAVRKVSGDERTIYKTGELRLMIDEELNYRLGDGDI